MDVSYNVFVPLHLMISKQNYPLYRGDLILEVTQGPPWDDL